MRLLCLQRACSACRLVLVPALGMSLANPSDAAQQERVSATILISIPSRAQITAPTSCTFPETWPTLVGWATSSGTFVEVLVRPDRAIAHETLTAAWEPTSSLLIGNFSGEQNARQRERGHDQRISTLSSYLDPGLAGLRVRTRWLPGVRQTPELATLDSSAAGRPGRTALSAIAASYAREMVPRRSMPLAVFPNAALIDGTLELQLDMPELLLAHDLQGTITFTFAAL